MVFNFDVEECELCLCICTLRFFSKNVNVSFNLCFFFGGSCICFRCIFCCDDIFSRNAVGYLLEVTSFFIVDDVVATFFLTISNSSSSSLSSSLSIKSFKSSKKSKSSSSSCGCTNCILLSIIIGFYIGKISYDSFSDNIILIRLT